MTQSSDSKSPTSSASSAATDAATPRLAASVSGMKLTNPEPPPFRMVTVSFLAAGVGLLAGVVAFALYKLIGLFTNIAFYHRWSAEFMSPRFNTLGAWVMLIPVIGGIIVGFMAK